MRGRIVEILCVALLALVVGISLYGEVAARVNCRAKEMVYNPKTGQCMDARQSPWN